MGAQCTVCSGKRLPFTATALNLAGKPFQYGGIAARVFGWGTLAFGGIATISVAAILQAIWPESIIGYAAATPIALLTLLVSLTAIIGGRLLGRRGVSKALAAKLETVRALARHQNGRVMASEVADALSVSEAQADAMLTELAKNPDDDVTLDLDDHGGIHYLFGVGSDALNDPKWRIVAQQSTARIATDATAEAEASTDQLAAEWQADEAQREARTTK